MMRRLQRLQQFFKNVVKTLNIEKDESILCDTGNECGPMRIETKKYKKYSNILKIKQ